MIARHGRTWRGPTPLDQPQIDEDVEITRDGLPCLVTVGQCEIDVEAGYLRDQRWVRPWEVDRETTPAVVGSDWEQFRWSRRRTEPSDP